MEGAGEGKRQEVPAIEGVGSPEIKRRLAQEAGNQRLHC